MFFRLEKRSFLRVNDEFASLVDIASNGSLSFNVSFVIDVLKAVTAGCTTVRVSARDSTGSVLPVLKNVDHIGYVDNAETVRNIIKRSANVRSMVDKAESSTVATSIVDLTAFVNNERTNDIVSKAKSIAEPRLKLKTVVNGEVFDNKPILAVAEPAGEFRHLSSSIDTRTLLGNMLIIDGIDPSDVCDITDTTSLAFDSVSGLTFQRRRPHELHEGLTLYSSLLRSLDVVERPRESTLLDDSEKFQVMDVDGDDLITASTTLTLEKPRQASPSSKQLAIVFELIDSSTGVPIDSVTKTLNVVEHIRFYTLPKQPPQANIVQSPYRAYIEVKKSPHHVGVDVYKRSMNAVTIEPEYTFVGTFEEPGVGELRIDVERARSGVDTYRLVPIGFGAQRGHSFTNVVLSSEHRERNKAISIVTAIDDLGVKVEVRNFPIDVVSVEMIVKDRTAFDSEYSNVDGRIHVVDDAIRAVGVVSIVDGSVCDQHVYEYACRLFYKDGTTVVSGCSIVQYRKYELDKVDTRINNLNVQRDPELNVTFDVTTEIVDTNVGLVRKLLQNAGMYDLFVKDVENERDKLQSLIAHNVQRIDLRTGEREDFGVIIDRQFSDASLRAKNSVKGLKHGRSYRYEIVTLVRDPSTMLDITKNVVDPVTKRTYQLNSRKFRHPFTLKRGTLLDHSSQTTSSMLYGQIGGVVSFEASFVTSVPYVSDVEARIIDPNTVNVQWSLVGDASFIDHFIIMHEVNGVRSVVGRSHAFSKLTHGFVHQISRRFTGPITYVVVPVHVDFNVGSPVRSNVVVVNDSGVT